MTTRTEPETAGHSAVLTDPAYQAFLLLRAAFTLAPVVFGLDKFFATYARTVSHRPTA